VCRWLKEKMEREEFYKGVSKRGGCVIDEIVKRGNRGMMLFAGRKMLDLVKWE